MTEHECANRHSSGDLKQGWITPLMRFHVDVTESHTPIAAVVVYSEVSKLLVACPRYHSVNKLRVKRTISKLSCDVIHTVYSRMDLSHVKRQAVGTARDASKKHRTMFVVVTRKQATLERHEMLTSDSNCARVIHCNFSRKSKIFRSFAVTVCEPF